MKIAICLSGGPRFKQQGLFKLIDALKGFDHADFFIRTWKTSEYGSTPEEFENYLRTNGLPDSCHFKITQVLDDAPENWPEPKPNLRVAEWAPNFLTMWWGIVQCHQLFLEYVNLTGENYDLVIRMRTDCVPGGDINLADYIEKAQTKMINAKNFGDTFLFGSPAMYSRFVDYWEYLDYLNETGDFVHPEESLEKYFKFVGIDYECLPVTVQPAWDKGEYKGRWRLDHQ
jgi:hypothetical protein